MKKLAVAIALALMAGGALADVILLTMWNPYSQNFDIGTSATAAVPDGWRVSKNDSTGQVVDAWSAAGSNTAARAGNNMTSNAAQGIYNYGAGDPATATDRAVGFVSSSGGTRSGNLYAHFKNNDSVDFSGFILSYSVEKYRNGKSVKFYDYRFQLYSSADGSTWTSAGDSFKTSWPTNADNSGFATAPGDTKYVQNQTLGFYLTAGSDLYLALSYGVASGNDGTNGQGLGIDDFTVTPTPEPVSLGLVVVGIFLLRLRRPRLSTAVG